MEENKTQNKQKLLFLVTEDWYFVSHRLQLGAAALEAGYEVSVATRAREDAETIRKKGIDLIPFELSRRVGNPLRELLALITLYRRERPDIVHHVALKPVFLGSLAARLSNVPIQVNAVTGLGWLFISQSRLARWISPMIRWFLARLLSFRKDRVIVQNRDDKELLMRAGVPESQLKTIRGAGVDTQVFSPSAEPPEPVCVVLAARMLWDKGVREFVEAARQLKHKGVNARFILVGAPDLDNPSAVSIADLEAWQKENVVEWWGHREDMRLVFKTAHVACLPSYREGLPKVLLEAASCGLPIVSTDVPGCREVVREGENGFLVPVKNAETLAKALAPLIENPELRTRMGKRGREMVMEEFSSKHVIAQTLDLYRELVR